MNYDYNPPIPQFPQGKSSDQIVYRILELIHVFVMPIHVVPNKTIGLIK